jgi:hypothetical protein
MNDFPISLRQTIVNGKIRLCQVHNTYRWYDGETLQDALVEFSKRTGNRDYIINEE